MKNKSVRDIDSKIIYKVELAAGRMGVGEWRSLSGLNDAKVAYGGNSFVAGK